MNLLQQRLLRKRPLPIKLLQSELWLFSRLQPKRD